MSFATAVYVKSLKEYLKGIQVQNGHLGVGKMNATLLVMLVCISFSNHPI